MPLSPPLARAFPARVRLALVLLAALSLLAPACAVGPDYKRPQVAVPAAFKEGEGWRMAQPADLQNHGQWWSQYNDATLDDLQQRLLDANQTLAESEASYRQSVALVKGAAGVPNLASYQRWTRASLRSSTWAGTSWKRSEARRITASSASQDRSVSSK